MPSKWACLSVSGKNSNKVTGRLWSILLIVDNRKGTEVKKSMCGITCVDYRYSGTLYTYSIKCKAHANQHM